MRTGMRTRPAASSLRASGRAAIRQSSDSKTTTLTEIGARDKRQNDGDGGGGGQIVNDSGGARPTRLALIALCCIVAAATDVRPTGKLMISARARERRPGARATQVRASERASKRAIERSVGANLSH